MAGTNHTKEYIDLNQKFQPETFLIKVDAVHVSTIARMMPIARVGTIRRLTRRYQNFRSPVFPIA